MSALIEWNGDVLKRKKYSLFLTKYIESKSNGIVININGQWGSGKTFFLEKWYEDVKNNYPAVYFNAWENDFSSDPFVSLISCINSQIAQINSQITRSEAQKSFISKSGTVIRKISPAILKGILKKYIGEDGLKELSEITSETEDTISDISSQLAEELLKNHEQTSDIINDFKKSLSKVVDELTEKQLNKPLFIFIDELDRCKPIYAIELLERIKHIFNIPGVVFIIATDTAQLSHSVKAIYGEEFNGEIYLRRFFDQIYTLPKPNCVSFVEMLFEGYKGNAKYFEYSVNAIGGSVIHGKNGKTLTCEQSENSEKILIFSLLSIFFDFDLRTIKQCFERFIAIEASLDFHGEIHFAYLIFLIMLDAKDRLLFHEFFQSNDMEKILHELPNSTENIRIYTNYYTAYDLVVIYVNSMFLTKDDLQKKLKDLDNTNPDSFEANLTYSILNNYDKILSYTAVVEMAYTLG